LAGATDAMLRRIAGLAGDAAETDGRDRFWTRGGIAPPTRRAAVSAPAPASPVDVVFGVRLAPGVTVVLDGAARTPTQDQVAAIRRAAGPLLAALTEHGLIREGKNTP